MSVYRFPPIAIKPKSLADQIDKLYEEVGEVWDAFIDQAGVEVIGMELLDIIHAVETALRMEFEDSEVEELRAKVIEKNGRRGYYGTVD